MTPISKCNIPVGFSYKVRTRDDALALLDYWIINHNVFPSIEDHADWWELKSEEGHFMWREICDAFIAGMRAAQP